MNRHRKYVVILILTAVLGCLWSPHTIDAGIKSDKKPQPLNIVLITISSLRADHVGCLGYHRDTTAAFDSFAKEGILFTQTFAVSGWMMPAHGSIFTALYPNSHGATHIDKKLGSKHKTLAEILKANGYVTVGFCFNPRLDSEHGFDRGFDIYDDYSAAMMLQSLTFDSGLIDINKHRTNDLINTAALAWLDRNDQHPFLLFVHYYDNHWDYLPPSPYDKLYDPNYDGPINGRNIAREPLFSNPPDDDGLNHMIALYDGQIRRTDDDLAILLNALRKKQLFENSIIILLADHGEQFYEHGHTSHQGLFEELIHIPLAIHIPGMQNTTKPVDALVSQIDILPTILDYLSITIPKQCQGKSLRTLIEGKTDKINDVIFAQYSAGAIPDCYVARSKKYKCYSTSSESYAFDLEDDPGELSRILPCEFPEQARILSKKLSELLMHQRSGN